MKTLYLLRHAKSSWKHPELDDFERPLNKRGKHDVPVMGQLLQSKKIIPDLILSSPANRAAMTARIIAENLSLPSHRITYDDLIYESSSETLFDVVRTINPIVVSAILVGHNPGITTFANLIADHRVGNIPTCGIYGVELNIASWQEISDKCATFKFFEYPKKS
jgi:phosphohistidine phosphatase